MNVMLALVGALLVTTTASIAQQAKAPKDCISCEAMCDWCIGLGRQSKADRSKCHQGCRSWGSMVGLATVYVHKHKHLCGTGSYAPRCN